MVVPEVFTYNQSFYLFTNWCCSELS